MANLSNINNKLIVTDGGNLLVNATANLATYGGITIDNFSDPSIAMKTTGTSGWLWTQYITSTGTNNFSMGVNQSSPYWCVKAGAGMDSPHLVVNSSGNVGIGTISPTSPTSVGTFLEIRGRNGIGGGTAGIVLKDYDNDGWDIWNSGGQLNFRYNNDGAVGFFITSSGNSTFAGNVKIYKANALLELGENSTAGNFGFIGWDDASNYLFIGNSYSSAYNKNIVISNTGNVGIGTDAPSAKFTVNKAKSGTGVENYDLIRLNLTGTGAIGDSSTIAWHSTNGTKTAGIEGISGLDNIAYGELAFSTRRYTTDTYLEAMRINNRGNVGIGTTSPDVKLDIEGTGGEILRLRDTDGSYTALTLYNDATSTDSRNWGIFNNGYNYGDFNIISSTTNTGDPDVTNATRLTITKDGKVGIGTVTPGTKLSVADGDIEITGANAVSRQIRFMEAGVQKFAITNVGSDDSVRFYTAVGGDILNLKDGKVGIGTVSPDNSLTVKGISIGGTSGKVSIYGGGDENNWTAARNEAIRIGRADILGAYYHSIWAASGSGSESSHWLRFYISNANGSAQTMAMQLDGNGNVGIGTTSPAAATRLDVAGGTKSTFYTSDGGRGFKQDGAAFVSTYSNGADGNAVNDIGSTTNRWRDGFFSGGVYLGGTAAANKLDHYEEGTWTPTLLFGGNEVGIAYGGVAGTVYRGGHYTRVGRVVTFSFRIILTSKGTSTGDATITGLPLVVANLSGNYGSAMYSFANNFLIPERPTITMDNGSSIIRLRFVNSPSGSYGNVIDSGFNNNSDIILTGTYQTS